MYEPSFLYVISPQKTRDLFSAMAVSIYFDLFSVYVLEKCVGEGVTYPKMFHLLNRNNVQKWSFTGLEKTNLTIHMNH